jgi:T-complex protein 1 subunit theta
LLFSKWDVRRLCKAVGATPLPKMTEPTAEELGYADKVFVDELGDTSVVVFRMVDKVYFLTNICFIVIDSV